MELGISINNRERQYLPHCAIGWFVVKAKGKNKYG